MSEWAVQGLSIAVVSKDSKGAWRHEAKGWGVADRHGNPVTKDHSARYLNDARQAKEVEQKFLVSRRDDAPLPSLPIQDLATNFAHPTYGGINLCVLPSSDVQGPIVEASVACQKVISSVGTLLDNVLPASKTPRLVSHSPRHFGTHLVFTHFSNNTFNLTFWNLVRPEDAPTSRDKSERPFIIPTELNAFAEPPTLTFDIDEAEVAGFGLRGVWRAGAGVQSLKGESVKERSEVWFQRL